MNRLNVDRNIIKASFIALVILIIYLLAYQVRVVEENRDLQKQNKATLAALAKTNDGIVGKLTEVFTQAAKAEEAARAAGTVPQATVDAIAKSLQGYVDQTLIDQAVQAAKDAVAGQTGPKGDTGAQGKTGATGATGAQGQSGTATTSAPATTTSTTRSPTTTTSTTQRTPTTTTRPCIVQALGLKLLC